MTKIHACTALAVGCPQLCMDRPCPSEVVAAAPAAAGGAAMPAPLPCRADGQAGHACQAGDDVNIFF